jgi:DNA-binding Xre family transcriptional regulator
MNGAGSRRDSGRPGAGSAAGGPARPDTGGAAGPPARPAADDPGVADPRTGNPGTGNPGAADPGAGNPGAADPGAGNPGELLPLLPGFREMALRRMAEERRRLVTDLTAERQAARLSQTEVAARMGTSQSAVARLESGEADARATTLERYAAAIGCQITWRLQSPAPRPPQEEVSGDDPFGS